MDAAGAVDAQNAPTAPWKTAQNAVSHSAHTHHRSSGGTKKRVIAVNPLYTRNSDSPSATRKLLWLKGLRGATMPSIGQQRNQLYEIYHETFTSQVSHPCQRRRVCFQGVNDGPYNRAITGKVRYSIAPSGFGDRSTSCSFLKHGQTIKGIMNRYSIARSNQAVAIAQKHDDVFFGGNFVALDFDK
jgi:hypothetical protein